MNEKIPDLSTIIVNFRGVLIVDASQLEGDLDAALRDAANELQ